MMAERGSARSINTSTSRGSSFLPWVSGGLDRSPSRPSSLRVASRLWSSDEDDDRPWGGLGRRRHGISQSKDFVAKKGPAFWRKAATAQQQKLQLPAHLQIQPLPAQLTRGRRSRLRMSRVALPRADHLVCPQLQKVVYVLVALALILSLVIMILIGVYIRDASIMDSSLLHLEGQRKRLAEAVRNAAQGQRLHCVPCQKYWMQAADACYLFTNEKLSWQGCIENCKAQNSSLLIGQTEGEMAFLMLETRRRFFMKYQRLLHARFWIGLMYNQTTKTWLWANGAHLHLRTDATENIPSFVEDICVAFYKGHTNNKRCSVRNHCLCKRKAH